MRAESTLGELFHLGSPLYGVLATFVFGLAARPNRENLRPIRIGAALFGLLLAFVPYGAFLTGGWLFGVNWGRGGSGWERAAAVVMLGLSAYFAWRRD